MMDKKLSGGLTYKGAVKTYDYLLDERVKNGTAKILEGNVKRNLKYIKMASDKFSRSWSSGVMSFEETISEEDAREIIAFHKRVTFCGMTEDQFDGVYILHLDKGRTEIHYVHARIECTTGKALNPYYVTKDFKKKDLFQDLVNAEYGLSSPKSSRSRELVSKKKKKWTSKKSTIQKEIDESVLNLVNAGAIHSRDDIIDFLRENDFEINRLRKGSISVKHDSIRKKDGSLDPIPLKGAIYGENFTDWGSLEESIIKEDQGARRAPEEIRRELDSIIRSQAEYNRKRFGKREETDIERSQSPNIPDPRIELGIRNQGRKSDIHKQEKESDRKSERETERGIDHERVRKRFDTNVRRRREKARRSRIEYEERKRVAFERANRLVTDLQAGIGSEQRENIESIKRVVEQVSTVGKQVEQYTQAIKIERETIRIVEDVGIKISGISRGVREWFGRKVEAIREQIGVLGEEVERWLEDKNVKEAKKRNAEARAKIKSVLVDDKIEQVPFQKPKR